MPEKTKSARDAAFASAPGKPRKRSLFGKLRLVVLLAILAAVVAIQPPVFRRLIGAGLQFAAWQRGVSLNFGRLTGSIFDPVVLRDVVWTRSLESGGVARIEVRRARASLAWSNIFPDPIADWLRSAARRVHLNPIGRNGRWFQELELDDVTAKISLPSDGKPPSRQPAYGRLRAALGESGIQPAALTVRNGDLIIVHGSGYLRARDTRFSLSEIEPGTFFAGELIWKGPAGGRVFRRVLGRTSLEESRITLAGMQLAPDVTVQRITFSSGAPGSGRLTLAADLAAFGGRIEAEAESETQEGRLRFDATGTFAKINIAGLAAFLDLGEAAGGVLKEGRFSFRGTPGDFAHAEATVRLEAGAFQWESRQWDSLVLGFSLLDQRLEIPELQLRQGRNQLTVRGSMAMPQPGAHWWERQFDLKVDADIRNLTDLSALILPDFKYAAGQLFVRGSVSGTGAAGGKPPKFDGQLIVNGSGLQWRTAPVDVLNAALVFHDRELQIISALLLRGDDLLRGSGHISLTDGSYAGEVRLSARDLATYKSVLSPALLPAPLGGGVEMAWSGKGGAAAHDGRFTARLNRFHLLGPQGTLPLDAECSGTYRPGEVQLEKLRLSEDGTSLTAGIIIAPSAVNVREIRIRHRDRVWLQGDAFLPLNLWQRWPDVNLAHLLNDEVVSRVRFEANGLDLRQTSRLTGIDWPLAGTLTAQVTADGSLRGLKLGGAASVIHGTIPLNWRGSLIRDVDAAFTLDGSVVRLDKAAGKYPGGEFSLAGRLDLQNPRSPAIEVEGNGTNMSQPFQFTAKGPGDALAITTEGAAPFPGTALREPEPPPASAAK